MKNGISGRKGQTALEYLMTYGWMIIIIGVVAVVLWQMGIFTPQSTPPGCTGFSQITPSDWKASYTSGNLTMTLFNNAGTQINLTDVNVSVFNTNCTGAQVTNGTMRAGEYYQVVVPNNCSRAFSSLGVGQYYKADITIVYSNLASGIGHNSVGECHGSLES